MPVGGLRSVSLVLTAASTGVGKGGGYARYLESKTVAPERGDYYLSPTGSPPKPPANGWHRRKRWPGWVLTLVRLGPGFCGVDGGPPPQERGVVAEGGR